MDKPLRTVCYGGQFTTLAGPEFSTKVITQASNSLQVIRDRFTLRVGMQHKKTRPVANVDPTRATIDVLRSNDCIPGVV
jgi:hypothetical protein